MVRVCDSGSYSLWTPSGLHKTGRRPHLRWFGRLGGGRHRDGNHRDLPGVSLAQQHMDTESDSHGDMVLDAHGNKRRCRHAHVFPSVSKRRTPLGGTYGSGRRCRSHGHLWHSFFQRVGIMAKAARNCLLNSRSSSFAVFIREMKVTTSWFRYGKRPGKNPDGGRRGGCRGPRARRVSAGRARPAPATQNLPCYFPVRKSVPASENSAAGFLLAPLPLAVSLMPRVVIGMSAALVLMSNTAPEACSSKFPCGAVLA